MKTHKPKTQASALSSCQHLSCFHLRSRKKKEVIQGKVRIRSMPGAFLILGLMVVIVGMTLAVVGYWPYRVQRSAGSLMSKSTSQASNWGIGAKGLLSAASLVHNDRMKLVGPVIMGVGLFILICANTVLYENRDKETQILLSEMQSVICTVTSEPSDDFHQVNSLIRNFHWVNCLPTENMNILSLKKLASSEPLLQIRTTKKESVSLQREVMHAEVLHHQASSFFSSIHLSDSCNSIRTYLDVEQGEVCGHQPQLYRQHFSNQSMCPEEKDSDLTKVPTRHSHRISNRINSHIFSKPVVHLEEMAVQNTHCLKQYRQSGISDGCVHHPGFSTNPTELDPAPLEVQKHHSWS